MWGLLRKWFDYDIVCEYYKCDGKWYCRKKGIKWYFKGRGKGRKT